MTIRATVAGWNIVGSRKYSSEDFERGKQLTPVEREYIFRRQKNYETYTENVPRNEVGQDIVQIFNIKQDEGAEDGVRTKAGEAG